MFCLQIVFQIPNGNTVANALAGFMDGFDRFCGRYLNLGNGILGSATVCSKSTLGFKSILLWADNQWPNLT